MRRILLSAAVSLAFASSAQAGALEIGLGDDSAELFLTAPTGPYGFEDGQAGAGVAFNEDDDIVGQLSLEKIGRISESLRFNVGVKGYFGDMDRADETFSAVGVGGSVRFGLASSIPMGLILRGYIAPSVLSFSGAEGVTELDARVEAEFARSAAAFVGYSFMEVDLEGRGDVEVRDGLNVGVRLNF